jgi:large conductance mechanosensitive channel
MGMIAEFKEFINKGNMIDLAVGLVAGAAFGKLISSFVDGVVLPPIGKLISGVNFSDMKYVLDPAIAEVKDATGKIITAAKPEAAIKYGEFFQSIIDFLLVMFVIFLVVKAYNRWKKEAPPPPPSSTDTLLGEIRDLLKR